MQITVKRLFESGEATLGRLSINGDDFCFTLEDRHQDQKIAGKTRIPAGTYKVIPRWVGRFFKAYTENSVRNRRRFTKPHSFALEIENVPAFTHILIHTGNDHTHTSGCLLVGMGVDIREPVITQSSEAYSRLYDHIEQAVIAGECWITIEDETTRP